MLIAKFDISGSRLPLNAIHFDNKSEGTDLSFQWNFGDGEESNERNPSHQYKSSGTYQVKLTIVDKDQDYHSLVKTVKIRKNYYPVFWKATNVANTSKGTLGKHTPQPPPPRLGGVLAVIVLVPLLVIGGRSLYKYVSSNITTVEVLGNIDENNDSDPDGNLTLMENLDATDKQHLSNSQKRIQYQQYVSEEPVETTASVVSKENGEPSSFENQSEFLNFIDANYTKLQKEHGSSTICYNGDNLTISFGSDVGALSYNTSGKFTITGKKGNQSWSYPKSADINFQECMLTGDVCINSVANQKKANVSYCGRTMSINNEFGIGFKIKEEDRAISIQL